MNQQEPQTPELKDVPPVLTDESPGEQTVLTEAPAGGLCTETLQQRIAELEDKLLRARADFSNFQRSARQEREQIIRYANVDLIRSLLTSLDDLERSLELEITSDDAIKLREGVKLVHENILKALRERDVEIIAPLHQPFDPSVHEALARQPSAEYPPHTVVAVLAKGYRLGDRVIRPARVVVASAPEPEKERERQESKTT